MATLISTPRIRAFILSEAPGFLSRENATVTLAGAALKSGSILTKSGAKFVPYAGAATGADAVLYTALPSATGDVKAVVIVRNAEVNRFEMTGVDANAITKLAANNVIVRGNPNVLSVTTPVLA